MPAALVGTPHLERTARRMAALVGLAGRRLAWQAPSAAAVESQLTLLEQIALVERRQCLLPHMVR